MFGTLYDLWKIHAVFNHCIRFNSLGLLQIRNYIVPEIFNKLAVNLNFLTMGLKGN